MAIRSKCPTCGHVYSLKDESLGKRLRCSTCLGTFEVLRLNTTPDTVADASAVQSLVSTSGNAPTGQPNSVHAPTPSAWQSRIVAALLSLLGVSFIGLAMAIAFLAVGRLRQDFPQSQIATAPASSAQPHDGQPHDAQPATSAGESNSEVNEPEIVVSDAPIASEDNPSAPETIDQAPAVDSASQVESTEEAVEEAAVENNIVEETAADAEENDHEIDAPSDEVVSIDTRFPPWQEAVDPRLRRWTPSEKLRVPASKLYGGRDIVVSAAHGPFIAVRNSYDEVDIWNLETAQRTGHCGTTQKFGGKSALSADGAWFVECDHGYLNFYSTLGEERGPVVTTNVTEHRDGILAMTRYGALYEESNAFSLFDAATGKRKRQHKITSYRNRTAAISPGGRYLAVSLDDSVVQIVDLRRGKVAGSLRGPEEKVGQKLLAFSQDGSQLAAFYAYGQNVGIARWDMKTGEPLQWRSLPDRVRLNEITFCWLADDSGWLVGREFVVFADRERPLLKLDSYDFCLPVAPNVLLRQGKRGQEQHEFLRLESIAPKVPVAEDSPSP